MEIQFGCSYGSDNIIVIQISEEIESSLYVANLMKQLIQKENVRRLRKGEQKIAYKIITSKNMNEKYCDVASGLFYPKMEEGVIYEVDTGFGLF